MKKLDMKYKLDDAIYSAYNLMLDIRGVDRQMREILRANKEFENTHRGRRCFILGNGPSLNEMDLSLLRSEQTFVCNYFYKHPQAVACNPKYYVIVDGKLADGTWPVDMLEEIRKSFPGITLLLNAEFHANPTIRSAAEGMQVAWILGGKIIHPGYKFQPDLTSRIGGDNVTKVALQAAFYMGFTDVHMLGIDGDGLFRELLGKSSHFYDGADNLGGQDFERMILDLWLSTEGFRSWKAIADRYRYGPVNIYNSGIGGLLNCFPRIPLTAAIR